MKKAKLEYFFFFMIVGFALFFVSGTYLVTKHIIPHQTLSELYDDHSQHAILVWYRPEYGTYLYSLPMPIDDARIEQARSKELLISHVFMNDCFLDAPQLFPVVVIGPKESPLINRCKTPPPRLIIEGTEEYNETIVSVLKSKVM